MDTTTQKKGTARGMRGGHAPEHRRAALIEALESWEHGDLCHWADHESIGGKDGASAFLGKLWHSTDTVPRGTREIVTRALDCEESEVATFARIARRLKSELTSPADVFVARSRVREPAAE